MRRFVGRRRTENTARAILSGVQAYKMNSDQYQLSKKSCSALISISLATPVNKHILRHLRQYHHLV